MQTKIFGHGRCVQPAESLPLLPSLAERAVVLMVHMTVLDQHAGQLLLPGMPYDAIVILSLLAKPCLDAPRIQPQLLQSRHLNIGEGIPLAVTSPEGGHPALSPEERVVIFGKIIVETEEKIGVHSLGKRHPPLEGDLSVLLPRQVDGDILVLFQLFFHGFGGNQRHVLLDEGVVHAALFLPAVPRINHDHKFIRRRFLSPFTRRSVFLHRIRLCRRLHFRPHNRHPVRKNADRKTEAECQKHQPAHQKHYAVIMQAIF